MNEVTLEKLKKNPHYKDSRIPQEEKKEEPVRTFGYIPKQDTSIHTHPTGPQRVPQKKRIDKH